MRSRPLDVGPTCIAQDFPPCRVVGRRHPSSSLWEWLPPGSSFSARRKAPGHSHSRELKPHAIRKRKWRAPFGARQLSGRGKTTRWGSHGRRKRHTRKRFTATGATLSFRSRFLNWTLVQVRSGQTARFYSPYVGPIEPLQTGTWCGGAVCSAHDWGLRHDRRQCLAVRHRP